mmetsp:Transcript_123304/g.360023  ORF Transcript_123304/g.360023 Transcript_123304/m.360023 type:complete len:243 (-) Transcript_123304:636-1364(-)
MWTRGLAERGWDDDQCPCMTARLMQQMRLARQRPRETRQRGTWRHPSARTSKSRSGALPSACHPAATRHLCFWNTTTERCVWVLRMQAHLSGDCASRNMHGLSATLQKQISNDEVIGLSCGGRLSAPSRGRRSGMRISLKLRMEFAMHRRMLGPKVNQVGSAVTNQWCQVARTRLGVFPAAARRPLAARSAPWHRTAADAAKRRIGRRTTGRAADSFLASPPLRSRETGEMQSLPCSHWRRS